MPFSRFENVGAPLLVAVDDDFGIGVVGTGARALQLGAQLLKL